MLMEILFSIAPTSIYYIFYMTKFKEIHQQVLNNILNELYIE